MRQHSLVVAAVLTGSWLAACSQPAPTTDTQATSAEESARHINLAGSPRSESPVVSDLESGIRRGAGVARAISPRRAPVPAVELPGGSPVAEAEHHRTMAESVELPQRLSLTTSAVTAAPALGLEPMPAAAPGPADSGPAAGGLDGASPGLIGSGPDPLIIIRGGRGGVRDDCDLHRRGIPAAVNRMAPPLGGGYGRTGTISYPQGVRIR